MSKKNLTELTDEELLQEAKKIKSSTIFDALIFGVLIGIAIYSSVKNGFGLLTFLPIIYTPIALKNKIRNRELKKLLTEKSLE